MKKIRDFKDGNIIELKEPYEYLKGQFTKIFEYETWSLDGAAFRPYHKGTCTHFRLVDSKGKEMTYKQIMARTSHLWETEQEFFQNGGPQLGMYEFGNDIYQVIQKADGKISALRMSKNSTQVSWDEFFLHYWIDVVEPNLKPLANENMITRLIEERTPEVTPFWAKCINPSMGSRGFQNGALYKVINVVFRKNMKYYRLVSDFREDIILPASQFVPNTIRNIIHGLNN